VNLSSDVFVCTLLKCASAIAFLSSLLACGGGGEGEPPLSPLAMANAAEARSRSLLKISSCSADAQCSFVKFEMPYDSCSQGEYVAYLANNRNAATAISTAKEQRYWASEARKTEPQHGLFACAAFVQQPPVAVCLQSQCSLNWDTGFQWWPILDDIGSTQNPSL
jgi:hypothetical protein